MRINKLTSHIQESPTLRFLTPVLTMFIIMLLRKPIILFAPYLHAENANIYMQGAIDHGLMSIFMPFAGYLQFSTRLVTLISLYISEGTHNGILLVPPIMNTISIAICALSVSYICTKHFDWLASYWIRFLACIAIALLPIKTGETYATVVNIFWWLSIFMALVSLNLMRNYEIKSPSTIIYLFMSQISCINGIFVGVATLFAMYQTYVKPQSKIKPRNFPFPLFAQRAMLYNLGNIVQFFVFLAEDRRAMDPPSVYDVLSYLSKCVHHAFFANDGYTNLFAYVTVALVFFCAILLLSKINKFPIINIYSLVFSIIALSLLGALSPIDLYAMDRYVFIPLVLVVINLVVVSCQTVSNFYRTRQQPHTMVLAVLMLFCYAVNVIPNFEQARHFPGTLKYNWYNTALLFDRNGQEKIYTMNYWSDEYRLNFNVNTLDANVEYDSKHSNDRISRSKPIKIDQSSFFVTYLASEMPITGEAKVYIEIDDGTRINYTGNPMDAWHIWIVDLSDYIGKSFTISVECSDTSEERLIIRDTLLVGKKDYLLGKWLYSNFDTEIVH